MKYLTDEARYLLFSGAFCAGLAVWGPSNAQAQDALYKGKQIRMVIASGAGGGYDAYARILAQFLPKYIPGNPSIIIQNMPGAAGMVATSWAYNAAPKDGSVILATYNEALPEPLYENPAAHYDTLKFEMIGSFAQSELVCVTWHTSSIKTIEDAKAREVVVSATGVTGDPSTLPTMLNAMLGTKFRVVTGYETTAARLAVERGEVDGSCGLSWSNLKGTSPKWIQDNLVNILLQTGEKALPDLPNVPLLSALVTDPTNQKVLNVLSSPKKVGVPYLMPPGTPRGMVEAVRRAFDAALADPDLRREAENEMLEISPITGGDMKRILADVYATPRPLIERAAKYSGIEMGK
jgi:tripartite-type tricarboxylate transporter receptor subunit TctC